MENTLEKLSKAELIALIGQKDLLIKERDFAVQSREEVVRKKDEVIQQKQAEIMETKAEIARKEAEIAKLRRMLFGQKRERFEASSIQLPLDFGGNLSEQDIKTIEELISQKAEKIKQEEQNTSPVRHPGRSPLPKHLSVKEIVLQPHEDTTDMVQIGQETSDSLQYEPSRYYIQRIIRPKYAPKPSAQAMEEPIRIAIAELPLTGFGKCMAGSGVIAQILIDKYCDHLPLYRQLQRFKREGIQIAPATMDHWAKLGMQRLGLLYEYQKEVILKSQYIQADETTIKVLDHQNKKGTTHQGYFWAYHDPLAMQTLFKYEPGRAGKYPFGILKDFTGYLQTDGYAGYDGLAEREDIMHLGCWAHARRKFKESEPYDNARASTAMTLIQELYAIERQAREKNLDADQIKEFRLQQALPKYNLLGKWISSNISKVLPKSPIGVAMRYALERWDELGNYMYEGKLQIDNNNVENAVRSIALGRKNFLFAGSHEGAQRAAVVYTFTDQCKRHNVNPQHWLKFVFENILDTKPSQYHTLLPKNFLNHNG
jgi:transposase